MPNPKDPIHILREGGRLDSARRSALSLVKNSPESHKKLVGDLFDHIGEMGLEMRDIRNASSIDPRFVREEIFKLAGSEPEIPNWITKPEKKGKKSPGVPTLFASDWHWGERVDGKQIQRVNSFDLKIAHARAKRLIDKTVDLLRNHVTSPNYPGIVFALGGDMVSGDIHEEIKETNELQSFPTLLDLYGVLIWCISTLADNFGNVYVPCVAGNHGRTSRKPRHKFRAETNYDWLLYQMLERHFKEDRRIQFQAPTSSDAMWNVFGYRYLMTHGDQFRSGDSMIGALGPILRGDHRKRTRNGQLGMEYDTMILGHFHQYCHMGRVIVNGSLKGYDEYAYDANFVFEIPKQALWITHPDLGITLAMPVLLEDPNIQSTRQWVQKAG